MMMKVRVFPVLAVTILLAPPIPLEASDWTWKQLAPTESLMSLSSDAIAIMPDAVSRGIARDTGRKFHAEYATWWGFDIGRYEIQTLFRWAEDRGGWNFGYGFNFFGNFSDTDKPWIRDSARKGPTISTAIGEIRTWAFDVDSHAGTLEADEQQCLGFGHQWAYGNFSGWKHHKKLLSFYACGNIGHAVSEEAFLRILSNFGIKGEFDALVEDH